MWTPAFHHRLLQRTDWFTQEKACEDLTILLDARPGKCAAQLQVLSQVGPSGSGAAQAAAEGGLEQVIMSFIDWLSSQLRCVSAAHC